MMTFRIEPKRPPTIGKIGYGGGCWGHRKCHCAQYERITGAWEKEFRLRGFVAEMDALGGFRGNDIPIVAIKALAVDHLLHGTVFELNVGGMCKTAFQTHLWL